MNSIVHYRAVGYRYGRSKTGKVLRDIIMQKLTRDGVAIETAGLDGTIFRQYPELTRCDAMQIRTTELH